MNDASFSRRQLLSLGAVVALTPALRIFPAQTARLAGRAAWLTPLAALPLLLGWLYLLTRLLALCGPGEGLPELTLRLIGGRAGRTALALTALWTLVYAGFVLRSGADRLVGTIYPHSQPGVFTEIMGLLALAAALAVPRALVRIARMVQPFTLGLLLVLLLFALISLDPENLLPLTAEDLLPAGAGALVVADVLTAPAAALCFLFGGVRREPGAFRAWAAWAAGMCAVLALLSAALLGSFGAELSAELSRPFFVLSRTLVFFRTLERVEALIVMLWIFPDFLTVSLYLWAGQYCLRLLAGFRPETARAERFDVSNGRYLIWLAAAAVTGFALLLAPDAQSREYLSLTLIPAGNLVFVFLFLPALYIIGIRRQSAAAAAEPAAGPPPAET